jgi:hypothetical protein
MRSSGTCRRRRSRASQHIHRPLSSDPEKTIPAQGNHCALLSQSNTVQSTESAPCNVQRALKGRIIGCSAQVGGNGVGCRAGGCRASGYAPSLLTHIAILQGDEPGEIGCRRSHDRRRSTIRLVPENGCRLRWPNPLPRPARANKQIGKQWTLQGLSPPVKIWECIPVADRATHVVHCTSQAAALMAPPDEQTRPWGIRPQRVERCASEDRIERKWWVVPPPQSLVDEKETPGPRGRRRMGDGRDAKPNYAACTARIVDRSV